MYTKEQREKVVREYESGIKACDLISKYNLSKSTLYDWLKLYQVRKNLAKNNLLTYNVMNIKES